MQVNWLVITYFVVGIFVIVGFSRGWWKEAITTVFLAVLVFFLQQPDVAQGFIDTINALLVTIWSIIPLSLHGPISDFIFALFAVDTGGGPLQFDPTAPSTWIMLLVIFVLIAVLIGRAWLFLSPTWQGGFLGALIGGVNGFIMLNLVREYLDGRSLPGSSAQTSEIVLAGNSDFGTAASALSIQATNLPTFTILDSIIPWLIIGAGLLFLFSILKTRFRILTNQQGMKRIDYKKMPPLYRPPTGPRPPSYEDAVRRIFGS